MESRIKELLGLDDTPEVSNDIVMDALNKKLAETANAQQTIKEENEKPTIPAPLDDMPIIPEPEIVEKPKKEEKVKTDSPEKTEDISSLGLKVIEWDDMPVLEEVAEKKTIGKKVDQINFKELYNNILNNYTTMDKEELLYKLLELMSEGCKRVKTPSTIAVACDIKPANRILQAIRGKGMSRDHTQKVLQFFWRDPIMSNKYHDLLKLIVQPSFFNYGVDSTKKEEKKENENN